MTVQTLLQEATTSLQEKGITTAALDATLLLAHVLKKDKIGLIREAHTKVSSQDKTKFKELLNRRQKHEPVAYILGEKEFMGHVFKVTPATLIPRPDSETLVEAVFEIFPQTSGPKRVADVGTGTGCLLLCVLSHYPTWEGQGVDISPSALEVAAENAATHNLLNRVEFTEGQWLQPLEKEVDILISNPPYIKSEEVDHLMPDVRNHEPHLALDGGGDGLHPYRIITTTAPDILKSGGYIFLEVGQGQARDVKEMLSTADWQNLKTYTDLAGVPRVVCAQRV